MVEALKAGASFIKIRPFILLIVAFVFIFGALSMINLKIFDSGGAFSKIKVVF